MQPRLIAIGRPDRELNQGAALSAREGHRQPYPGSHGLRPRGWRVIARLRLALGRVLVATTVITATAGATSPPPMSAEEMAMLAAINQYRVAQGRAPWQPELALAQVARAHSQHMATLKRLSHEGFQRRAADTGGDLCVENLLRGAVLPAAAVQRWTQSPAHHDNLLEPQARHAGVGIEGTFVTLLACDVPPVVSGSRENAGGPPGRP